MLRSARSFSRLLNGSKKVKVNCSWMHVFFWKKVFAIHVDTFLSTVEFINLYISIFLWRYVGWVTNEPINYQAYFNAFCIPMHTLVYSTF